MIPRPYVAIDTEFTGVEDKDQAQLFEVAMIYDDFTKPIIHLPYFWSMVSLKNKWGKWEPITYAEPYALLVNFENGLFKDLINNKPRTVEHDGVAYEIAMNDVATALTMMRDFAVQATTRAQIPNAPALKLQLGGKNVETDIRVIEGNARRAGLNTKIITDLFDHRTMDPGKMEAKRFGYTPGSDELNAVYNFGPQPHRAFFDALNVVKTIRKQFNINL